MPSAISEAAGNFTHSSCDQVISALLWFEKEVLQRGRGKILDDNNTDGIHEHCPSILYSYC
jgi:hypothetical protein